MKHVVKYGVYLEILLPGSIYGSIFPQIAVSYRGSHGSHGSPGSIFYCNLQYLVNLPSTKRSKIDVLKALLYSF